MCGILGPTAGESWLAYVGVPDCYPDVLDLAREVDDAMWEAAMAVLEIRKMEDPVLRVMADERCTLWTSAKLPAGTLPVGTEIATGGPHSDRWVGKIRARNRWDSEFDPADRVYVEWTTWPSSGVNYRYGARVEPRIAAADEVDTSVPMPLDMAALLAEIERESGVRCTPKAARTRRKSGVERTCDLCGRKGTRGFRVIPAGTAHTSTGPLTYCTGRTACQRRADRVSA